MNETQQDRDDRDMAMHYADMLAFEKEAEDALKAAAVRALTPNEIAALAWLARIPNPTEKRA
jgi:hypothetical protein